MSQVADPHQLDIGAGLMYFDGDIDVSTPQTTTSGILDTMGLAHLLGSGTPELARIGPRYPATGMDDPAARAAEAMSSLAARSRPVLVHFDIDVIDSTEFPLADFPHFNQGLGYLDALACLRVFCRHEAFGGLVITEVNPHRDPDGRRTARLAAAGGRAPVGRAYGRSGSISRAWVTRAHSLRAWLSRSSRLAG